MKGLHLNLIEWVDFLELVEDYFQAILLGCLLMYMGAIDGIAQYRECPYKKSEVQKQ